MRLSNGALSPDSTITFRNRTNNIPKSTGHEPDLLLEIAHLLLIV
jgi:hypothetical protein